MPLDPWIAKKIEGYQLEEQQRKADTRRRFPEQVAFADACRRVFGDVRIIRLENYETGDALGKVDEFTWIACQDFGKYGDPRSTVSNDKAVRRK